MHIYKFKQHQIQNAFHMEGGLVSELAWVCFQKLMFVKSKRIIEISLKVIYFFPFIWVS